MKWLSKTGQSPGTSAVTGRTDWGLSPLQHVESAGPHSNQNLSSLCSCTILDTHGCTKPLLQAKVGAHHPPVPLLFPARGPWEYQCHEKPASSENRERAQPHPTASPQEGTRAGHTALHLFKDHALCATETTQLQHCPPARSPISASAATPLILPKSSCSVSPLQRVVVYLGMLFLFCKKHSVFV